MFNKQEKKVFVSPDGIYELTVKNKFELIPSVGRDGGGSKPINFILKKNGKVITNSKKFNEPIDFRNGDISVKWKLDAQLVRIALARHINLETGEMLK